MSNRTPYSRHPDKFNPEVGRGEMIDLEAVLEIDPSVGREIRALRKARGFTLGQLSARAGLSTGYLSQVERSISHPSIKALHAIGRALDVTVSWFFPPGVSDEKALRNNVVRANARRKLQFHSGITDELLSPNLEREIEMLRCIFKPGANSGETPYRHTGEEAGLVVSGELQLWLDGEHIVLKEGDSFAFNSDLPHRYANRTSLDTVVIWVITPPSY